jgi:hypothetical protein
MEYDNNNENLHGAFNVIVVSIIGLENCRANPYLNYSSWYSKQITVDYLDCMFHLCDGAFYLSGDSLACFSNQITVRSLGA